MQKNRSVKIVKAVFLFFSFLIFILNVNGQDSEIKDEITVITIYVKLKMDSVPCKACFDTLEKKLKETDGVQHVKVMLSKYQITFSCPSTKVPSEDYLSILADKAGFFPVRIQYEKEEPENEEEVPVN